MGIELPSPQGEQLGSVGGVERTAAPAGAENLQPPQTVEGNATEAPASQELRTGAAGGSGSVPAQTINVYDTTTDDSNSPGGSAPSSLDDVPVVAADEDLIEKQWVDSVKRIVKETRSDPYKQGVAIGRLQADYLQKRYGKTVEGGQSA
jgi:hypothetical protein